MCSRKKQITLTIRNDGKMCRLEDASRTVDVGTFSYLSSHRDVMDTFCNALNEYLSYRPPSNAVLIVENWMEYIDLAALKKKLCALAHTHDTKVQWTVRHRWQPDRPLDF